MPVIYLTASSEYETFRRAKETLPAAYLLKPFRHAELAIQVELAYHHHQVNQVPTDPLTQPTDFYLPINKGYERVAKSNIAFLQAEGAYVKVFLAAPPTTHLLSMNLGYLSQFFTTPNFHRLSRSVLINLDHLERLERSQVFMKNYATALPLPENSRAELMKKLTLVRTR